MIMDIIKTQMDPIVKQANEEDKVIKLIDLTNEKKKFNSFIFEFFQV